MLCVHCQVVFVGFSLVVLGIIMVVLGILVGRSAVMVLRPGHARHLLLGFWMSSFFFLGILLHRVLVCLQGLCLFVTFLTILLVKFLLGAYLGMAVLLVFLPLGDWFRVVLVLCLLRWVVRVFAWVVILVEVLKESDYTGKHQHTLLDKVFRESRFVLEFGRGLGILWFQVLIFLVTSFWGFIWKLGVTLLVWPGRELVEVEGLHEPTPPGSCMRGSN